MKKASCFFLNFLLLITIISCNKNNDHGAEYSQVKADAGEPDSIDISLNPGNCNQVSTAIQLDGSNSIAMTGHIISYSWSYLQNHPQNTGGPAQIEYENSARTAVFVTLAGDYWFSLRVFNDQGWYDDDSVKIIVTTDTAKRTKTQILQPEKLGSLEAIAPASIVSANEKIILQYYVDTVVEGRNTITNDRFKILDLDSKSWTDLALPTNRHRINMATVGNKLFLSGGYIGNGYYDKVDILDLSTGNWTNLKQQSNFIISNSAVEDNKIFFFGFDTDGSGTSNRVDILDPATNTWSGETMGHKRSSCVIVPAGDVVYFADNPDYPPYTNVVDVYNIATHFWSQAFITSTFAGAKGVAIGNKVYFYGSNANVSGNNSVEVWDPRTGKSEFLCMGETYFNIYPYGDQLLFFRKFPGEWGYGITEFFKYDPATGIWTKGQLANSEQEIGGVGTILKHAGKTLIIGVGPNNYPESQVDLSQVNPLPDYSFWQIEF